MGAEQGKLRSALIPPEQSGRQGDDNRFLWVLENLGPADLQIVADGLHGTVVRPNPSPGPGEMYSTESV